MQAQLYGQFMPDIYKKAFLLTFNYFMKTDKDCGGVFFTCKILGVVWHRIGYVVCQGIPKLTLTIAVTTAFTAT